MKTITKFIYPVLVGVVAMLTPIAVHGQGSNLFASINGNAGFGGGSIFRYPSPYIGTRSVFISPLYQPRGMAFDSSGNLFVATNDYDLNLDISHGTVLKITPDGVMSSFATGFGDNAFIAGLAIDNMDNVFVMAQGTDINFGPSTLYKITPGGEMSPFGSVPGQSIGIACDSAGNIFAPDDVYQNIYKFDPAGNRSVFVSPETFPFTPVQGPLALACDGSGNLFASIINSGDGTSTNDSIVEFKSNGTWSTFATGLSNPKGLVFDEAGNLFVAEIPGNTTGTILEFTPGGTGTVDGIVPSSGGVAVVDSGLGRTRGNGGPEFFAFPRPNTTIASGVTTAVTLTAAATSPGTNTVTPIPDPSNIGPLPTGVDPTNAVAFDITTTATYTPPIIIAVQLPLFAGDLAAFNQLQILHWNGASWDNVTASDPARDFQTKTIYASTPSLSPFVVAKETLNAQVQQPINADGSSVFNVKRGVVPVVFTLTSNGVATCQLPPATISVTRTAGGVLGAIDESTYLSSADKGSNFRISNCQYVYNLAASSLGIGTYRVNISIGGIVVGSGTFALK